MMTETEKTYSEVYGILNMLGKEYISKLPSSLYNMIEGEKSDEYNPQYSESTTLKEQNISKKALSMIALFHLNYWCNSDKEKKELKELFNNNEEEKQRILREKYNTDNLFNSKKENTSINIQNEAKSTAMIKLKEKNIIQKIFDKIKNIFIRK